MTNLTADEITAGYPDRPVLAAVTLAVRAGEFMALIGPNGAGKTTLLRSLGRQLRPARGTVALDGVAVWDRSPGWTAQRIALALQGGERDRPLTVAEVVSLGRAPHRGWVLPFRAEDRHAVEVALARAGLADFAERRVTELSAGEAQRVGLARALAQEPAVLLVDEPTSHLDLRFQGEVLDQLRRLARDGLAVVAALHDLNLAALWADRVVLLAAGRVVAVGTPDEVLKADALSAAYGTQLAVSRHPEFGTPLVMPVPRK
ncbi:ABC transporter ATP-binding protein [Limnoglobus roseus]|uniref:ABC transporter ATP-binding protein n=1 Tax=Limnoglobus roseus TaxID=2598579 RepID=A0A5C1ASH5_9BACT|nr:ABC transporter ATP-binding protein [Limnoglobus roseus]QEL21043.1 ABC transporter ATP-binding protein [Limnoglobus roseus]